MVTGGSSGIGRAIAESLALDGCDVGIFYLGEPDEGRPVVKAIESHGGRGWMHIGDVSDSGQAQAAVFIGAASQGIPIFKYAPAQVKSAVADYGAASKEQMREIVAATLGLKDIPESDAADALAVGLCHLIQEQADVALGRIITPGQER